MYRGQFSAQAAGAGRSWFGVETQRCQEETKDDEQTRIRGWHTPDLGVTGQHSEHCPEHPHRLRLDKGAGPNTARSTKCRDRG